MSDYQYMTGICHAVLDHPGIRAAEEYGYSHEPRVAHQCSVCGEPIYEGESGYHIHSDISDWGWVHADCLKLEIMEA